MKGQIIAIQMDHLEELNFASDSSHALGLAAQNMGFDIFVYHPTDLIYNNGKVEANGYFAKFFDIEPFYEKNSEKLLDLSSIYAVMIRQDPPYNMEYLTSCHILKLLPNHVKFLNRPNVLINHPEKIIPTYFHQFIPKTIIASNDYNIKLFASENNLEVLIAKPLYGHGGNDIIKFSVHDIDNIDLKFPIVIQEFLSEIQDGDIRVIMSLDQILGCYKRIPSEGSFKANLVQGARAEKYSLTKSQEEICIEIGRFLKANDILIAGIDLIGNYLIEVNITSPTGIKTYSKLYGLGNIAELVIKNLQDRVQGF